MTVNPSNGPCFIDSNLWIYAATESKDSPPDPRHDIARNLIQSFSLAFLSKSLTKSPSTCDVSISLQNHPFKPLSSPFSTITLFFP
jgi:hypothetical protein